MKNKCLLVFCFFTFISFSQKSEGLAIYNAKTNFKFKNVTKENEKAILKKIFKESGKISKTKFELLFKDKESLFYGKKQLEKNETKIDFVSVKAKLIGNIYVNLKTKEIIQKKEKFGEVFLINKKINSYQWELTNEKIKLGDYICYKAILKHKKKKVNPTFAWYTPDIPINIGPLGYSGLAGFIVMLQDDIFVYTLNKIQFKLSEKEKNRIRKPKKGRKVTLKEFDSIYKLMIRKKDLLERESYKN
jgi:GLPGLI family protein